MTIANAETPRKNCKSRAVLLPLGSEPKVGTNIFFQKPYWRGRCTTSLSCTLNYDGAGEMCLGDVKDSDRFRSWNLKLPRRIENIKQIRRRVYFIFITIPVALYSLPQLITSVSVIGLLSLVFDPIISLVFFSLAGHSWSYPQTLDHYPQISF